VPASLRSVKIATHDVKDTAHWLSSPKREEVFDAVAPAPRSAGRKNDSEGVGTGDSREPAVA
jgi:hypothetical protein